MIFAAILKFLLKPIIADFENFVRMFVGGLLGKKNEHIRRFSTEVLMYILKKIRHSCVIRLLEVFESEKHFLMVMEYEGGGDLLQYVKKRKRLNEQSAKAIFK